MQADYDQRPVVPNGLEVRRRRHERGWSIRALVTAIGEASVRASGIRESLTPNLISSIEEHAERIPYKTLCLLSDGLDCDPVDILQRDGA